MYKSSPGRQLAQVRAGCCPPLTGQPGRHLADGCGVRSAKTLGRRHLALALTPFCRSPRLSARYAECSQITS